MATVLGGVTLTENRPFPALVGIAQQLSANSSRSVWLC
jgi:hypothetical protein